MDIKIYWTTYILLKVITYLLLGALNVLNIISEFTTTTLLTIIFITITIDAVLLGVYMNNNEEIK